MNVFLDAYVNTEENSIYDLLKFLNNYSIYPKDFPSYLLL